MKHARMLLDRFGSIRAITNASADEISAIKGIGEKTARRIADLVRKPYR